SVVDIEIKTIPTDGTAPEIVCTRRGVSISADSSKIASNTQSNYTGPNATFCCETSNQCNAWLGLDGRCAGAGYPSSEPIGDAYTAASQCQSAKRCYVPGLTNPGDARKPLGAQCRAGLDICVQGLCLPSPDVDGGANTNRTGRC